MESTGPPPEGDLNSGPAIIAATFVVAGVSTLVVALRLSVRIWITKSTWWDDWTILFATVRTLPIQTGEPTPQMIPGRECYRDRSGRSRSTLWLWSTRPLSHEVATY